MNSPRPRAGRLLVGILIAIPVLALIAQAVAWAQNGVDVPWRDDWHAYLDGYDGSLDPSYLFRPINETVTAVGKALDALSLTTIGGNVVIYQLISMLLFLGTILALQWRLLRTTLADATLAGAAFLLTLLMMRIDTYWGGSSNAFHQGLPLLAIVASLYVTLRRPTIGLAEVTVLFVLNILGGLTYISGAFASAGVGAALLVASRLCSGDDAHRLSRAGLSIVAAAAVTIAIQVVATFGSASGDSPLGLTWPWDPKFWTYGLGLIGGTLSFTSYGAGDDQLVIKVATAVIAAVVLAIATIASVAWLIRARPFSVDRAMTPLVFLILVIAVGIDFGLVAAARATYPDPTASPVQVFHAALGGHRPIWGTLLWPWVGALAIEAVRRRARGTSIRWLPAAALSVAAALVAVSASTGSFDYRAQYSALRQLRVEVLDCLVTRLNLGERLRCQEGTEWDLTDGVLRAMQNGRSFTQYLRFVPPPDMEPTLFRLSTASDSAIEFTGVHAVVHTADGLHFDTADVAMATLTTGATAELAACRILEVTTVVRVPSGAILHVFWSSAKAPQVSNFSIYSVVPADATAWVSRSFYLISFAGFADSIRIRFMLPPQTLDLKDIQIRCRMPANPPLAPGG